MPIFREIADLYFEVEGMLAELEREAQSAGDQALEQICAKKRELNDHAYFLFLFTRLEDHVRDQSSILIGRRKIEDVDWRIKSAWKILPEKKEDRIQFRDRLALLIDNTSRSYSSILNYYNRRNIVAHGGSFTISISVPTVIQDFEGFEAELQI